jgi:pimeloyl-ACP methyl ester carboxylesterase
MTDADYLAMEKSTIVRSSSGPPWLPLVRAANRGLSALAPAFAARRAERLFLTPPRPRRPGAEIELLERARARPMSVGGRRIEMWTWGAGPRVLLVHGWGGRGAQLGGFVDSLVARGFSVVAFDAPGHGASEPGPVTIAEITAAVHAVAADGHVVAAAGHVVAAAGHEAAEIRDGAGGRLAGIIAHSVGAVAAARALYEGVDADAAVFVGPAANLVIPAVRFTAELGFSRAVGERMRRGIEARVGRPFSAFEVPALAPSLDTPLLVIHDRGDAEVPWQHGVAVARAWRGAQMLTTDGLGHRRILRAPDVVAAAVGFVAARTTERRRPALADAELVESLSVPGGGD